MEFYLNGSNIKSNSHMQTQQTEDTFETQQLVEPHRTVLNESNQKSWIHIWGTLYAVQRYLETKGIKLPINWSNCPEYVNKYMQYSSYIDKCIQKNILEIRASDTLEPIIEWLRTKEWNLEGIEHLSVSPTSVLVAMRSHLHYWSNTIERRYNMTTVTRNFKGQRLRVLNIQNAHIFLDKFGNQVGIYRYIDGFQGITTIRLTK